LKKKEKISSSLVQVCGLWLPQEEEKNEKN